MIEAYLRLVQAKAVLAELEALLYRPSEPSGANQAGGAHRLAMGAKQ
jgi:hypothetical protein